MRCYCMNGLAVGFKREANRRRLLLSATKAVPERCVIDDWIGVYPLMPTSVSASIPTSMPYHCMNGVALGFKSKEE